MFGESQINDTLISFGMVNLFKGTENFVSVCKNRVLRVKRQTWLRREFASRNSSQVARR